MLGFPVAAQCVRIQWQKSKLLQNNTGIVSEQQSGIWESTCIDHQHSKATQHQDTFSSLRSQHRAALKSVLFKKHPQQTEQATRQNKFTFIHVSVRGLSSFQIRKKLSAAFERSGGISGDISSCLVL